jgi:cellulose biosynthesis protein BcsQ
MHVLGLMSAKGGSAKTTTAANLLVVGQKRGFKIAGFDCDTQQQSLMAFASFGSRTA